MCVILLQGQRKLFFVSPTSSRKRQSKLDKTRKTLNNQMAPRGCGRQQVWTYAGWQVFWGWGGGLPHRGRRRAGVMSGRGTCRSWPRGTYIVLLPVKLQRVPQLSQLGLQIRNLLLLLRQPWKKERWIERKTERKPHGRPIITRDNGFLGNMSPGNEQCYSQSKKLWTRHCCVGLLVGEERE